MRGFRREEELYSLQIQEVFGDWNDSRQDAGRTNKKDTFLVEAKTLWVFWSRLKPFVF